MTIKSNSKIIHEQTQPRTEIKSPHKQPALFNYYLDAARQSIAFSLNRRPRHPPTPSVASSGVLIIVCARQTETSKRAELYWVTI